MKSRNPKHLEHSNGPKRAGIYVRVSDEEQAVARNNKTKEVESKTSPQTQEKDCTEYCQGRGYVIVKIYRDIQRYRSGGRMVEPSGTRADRPGLLELFKDVDDGKIDVIVAWRQDRIARGINRAIIELKERLSSGKLSVELVKENFDLATFEILAWAAGVELRAKHDRLMLGVAGRLAKGLVWNMRPPYGYVRKDGKYEIDPTEARWVRQMWKWYADGVQTREIRRRLIAGGAPQNGRNYRVGVSTQIAAWHVITINKLLRREYYYTGKWPIDWGGTTYILDVPTIIDPQLAKRVIARRERMKAHPARHLKHNYLATGLIYCGVCGVKMTSRASLSGRRKRKTPYRYYRCTRGGMGLRSPGCPDAISAKVADAEIWNKVWDWFSNRDRFTRALDERVANLESQQQDVEAECKRLEKQMQGFDEEEQRVITMRRKGLISEAQFEQQLAAMRLERNGIERDWSEKRLLIGNQVNRLKELAEIYREEVLAGSEAINATPATAEEAEVQFRARRRIVERLVQKVDVMADKHVVVHAILDVGDAINKRLARLTRMRAPIHPVRRIHTRFAAHLNTPSAFAPRNQSRRHDPGRR